MVEGQEASCCHISLKPGWREPVPEQGVSKAKFGKEGCIYFILERSSQELDAGLGEEFDLSRCESQEIT